MNNNLLFVTTLYRIHFDIKTLAQTPTDDGVLRQMKQNITFKLQENVRTNQCFPPKGKVANSLTLTLTVIVIFGAARTVIGHDAAIGGPIFALLILITTALLGGELVVVTCWLIKRSSNGAIDVKLPPLLGMLIAGILLRNVPYDLGQFGNQECLNVERISNSARFEVDHEYACSTKFIANDMDPKYFKPLKMICLTVILLMAGLELDPVQLKNLRSMVVRATIIPCVVEATSVAVMSKLILGFPWTVGILLGCVLAAASPAVIIPCMMHLSQEGYGVAKGIPTLVIAVCSLNDALAISGFGIVQAITFNTGKPLWTLILHGPIEILIGAGFGTFWGILAQWIPNKDHQHVGFFRWLILFGGALIAIFGSNMIHYDGAGGLATITMAFVAGIQWRKEVDVDRNPVITHFQRMWIILEPVIFALIGTKIQINKINTHALAVQIVILLVSLIIRMISTYGAVSGGNLNRKEKIFMAFAWLPKATVQAALGPMFLYNIAEINENYWNTESNKEAWMDANPGKNITEWTHLGDKATWEAWGEDILTLAVMSILITAPLGAVLTLILGPKLLKNDEEHFRNLQGLTTNLLDLLIH